MNNDLISREALKEEVKTTIPYVHQDLILDIIDSAPTVETERPQGEWIKWDFKTCGGLGDWEYKCSNCEKVYGGEYNFCPNCGAEMKKGGAK